VQSVIITGASGGIGRELVKEFKLANYHVVGIDASPTSVSSDIDFLQFDLSRIIDDHQSREALKSSILELTHGNQIKALVNNAAIQNVKPFLEIDSDDWSLSLRINLLAPFFLSQLLYQELAIAHGSVLNISSIHASQTKKGFSIYATTKAALSSLTKILAIELGSQVRVNAIEPGAISTQMLEAGFEGDPERRKSLAELQPMKRIGLPSEVAKLAVFMTSDDARFVNGSTFAIDGGIRNQLHDPL